MGRNPRVSHNDAQKRCTLRLVRVNNRLKVDRRVYSRSIIWRTGIPMPISKSVMTARRFSAPVGIIIFLVAILKRRRLMQSEQAGIATLSATKIRVATKCFSGPSTSRDKVTKHTDITVYRSLVSHVFVPYNRVDELHETSETSPSHVQACTCIPCCAAHF
jgi:hypothetical protein